MNARTKMSRRLDIERWEDDEENRHGHREFHCWFWGHTYKGRSGRAVDCAEPSTEPTPS